MHSDSEGFYLPLDFDDVLFSQNDLDIPGGMVGSARRVLGECERLAERLEIPDDIDSRTEALWIAADDSQGEGDTVWQQYGVEPYTCVALTEGCRTAMETGAALVFT